MIQAIIFDVGGVLVRTLDQAPRRHWESRLGLPPGGAEAVVFNSAAGRGAQRGEVTEEAHWAWIGQELSLDDRALARFRHDFFSADRLDEDLALLVRRLHDAYQTAVISNAFDGLNHQLQGTYPLADALDLIVCSAEEGIMKPDAAIYQRALERLGRKPEEAVFVDDMLANVAGAEAVGMAAIHFQPGMGLVPALHRLGIDVDIKP